MKRQSQLMPGVLALALAAAPMGAVARHLDPGEALARVAVSPASPRKSVAAASASPRLARSVASTPGGEAGVYLFTTADGYLVLSADDAAEPVLGYGDGAIADDASIPPAMEWWMTEYARQIAAAAAAPALRAVERPDRAPIGPLVTTAWSQDAPYNAMCPSYSGRRSMTGCVATAMAQIMNYHQWPATGTGSHQYYYGGEWISLDFSQISFAWDNMRPSYAGNTGTERQKTAVAQLMYACGVSTDMQYSTSQSGTADIYVASALATYFGYDANVRYAERDYFGLLDWEEFIYTQLRDYGPVQYSGSSMDGGHSFVCDGYSADGYFHINWGWGGTSDGFFLLTALDPPTQGIGGSSSGFNYNQAVIANIRKARAGSKMYFNLMMDQGFGVAAEKTTGDTRPGDNITVTKRVVNYSTGVANGSLGVRFTNRETGAVKYGTASTRVSLQPLYPQSSYTTQIPSTLTAGTYDLTPVMCGTDGVWKDIPVKLSGTQSVVMTIKNGICTFADAPSGTLDVTDVELLTPVYLGNLFKLTAKVKNTGDNEFVGSLVPTLAAGYQPIAKSDQIALDILPGETEYVEFTGVFNHFASTSLPDEGTYTLYLVKEATNEIMSEGIEVLLHGEPETVTLAVDRFELDGDPARADREALAFTGTVSCAEGYFGSSLMVALFPYTSGAVGSVGYFITTPLFVGAGESADFTAGGAFAAGEPGQTYFAVLFDGQSPISASGQEVLFKVAETAGVDNVTAGDTDAVATSRLYNLAGTLVLEASGAIDAASAPVPSGLYILETVTEAGHRSSTKVVRP